MTVDEWAIRDSARDLAGLYRELDEQKYAAPRPPEARVMRSTPGPRPPANIFLISLDAHLTSRLFEFVRDACNYVEPTAIIHHHGGRLCDWLAWNAQSVSELDFADELLEEMQDQARNLNRRLHPQGAGEVAAKPERRQSARSITNRLAGKGHKVSPDLLRKWAERGHVTTEPLPDGTAGYLITECLTRAAGGSDATA